MKFKIFLSSLLMGLALSHFGGTPIYAQVTSGEAESQEEQRPEEILQKVVSIEFPGGSVVDFIELLHTKVDFNCIIQVQAKTYQLPEIKLKNVFAYSVLDALSFASNDEIVTDYNSHPYVQITVNNLDEPMTAVFNLKGKATGGNTVQFGQAVEALAEGGQGPATVLVEAIEAGLDFQGVSATPLETKYHQASGLFFAKGTPQQIDLVSEIVSEFTNVNRRPRLGSYDPLQGVETPFIERRTLQNPGILIDQPPMVQPLTNPNQPPATNLKQDK